MHFLHASGCRFQIGLGICSAAAWLALTRCIIDGRLETKRPNSKGRAEQPLRIGKPCGRGMQPLSPKNVLLEAAGARGFMTR